LCATQSDDTATATETTEQSVDELVQTTARRLLERGDDLQAVSTIPPEIRFTATTPDETTSYVLVGDDTLTAPTVVAAAGVAHRTPDIDALTIVTDSSDTASQVSTWLQEPFVYRTADGGVRWYRGSQPIATETQQAIHPPTVEPEEWYVSPEGTVVCLHDDERCTTVPLSKLQSRSPSHSALSTALLEDLPAEYKTAIEGVDKTPTDDASATHIQPEDAYAMRTPVWLPHVASGLRDTTILVSMTTGFAEHRPTPSWDQQDVATEEARAAAAFITQYLTDADGQTVALDDAVSLFCSWYYAHEDTTPIAEPTAEFKRGYKLVYAQPSREMTTTLPDCRWLYPSQ
jgi:hypothetical protein